MDIKNFFLLGFFRLAAKGCVPARWFESDLPQKQERTARDGRLKLEIVSHCWNYSHLLVYQLSSLVNFPPSTIDVTMTVFYCPEDSETLRLLDYFGNIEVPNVTWNWRSLPRQKLFRRGIGRNMAALQTCADWVWFTDCDLMFREKCLDTLADCLKKSREALFFPEEERCTTLLAEDNLLLQAGSGEPEVMDIDPEIFTGHSPGRATGPLQIVHGDVCRAVGYCRSVPLYQMPSETWCKAHEDKAFRWLLQTRGVPIPVPSVYRIKHIFKGRYRYTKTNTSNKFRMWLRKCQARIRGY